MIAAIADHLWQSTAFAMLVAVSAIALRGNRAAVRYALWFAASIQFLIPFSLLATLAIYAGHSALRQRAESPIDAGGELTLAAAPAESSSAVPEESSAAVDANLDMESARSSTTDRSMADPSESRALHEIESGGTSGAVSVERPEPEMRRAAASPAPANATVQNPKPATTQPQVTKPVETASPEPAPRTSRPAADTFPTSSSLHPV